MTPQETRVNLSDRIARYQAQAWAQPKQSSLSKNTLLKPVPLSRFDPQLQPQPLKQVAALIPAVSNQPKLIMNVSINNDKSIIKKNLGSALQV